MDGKKINVGLNLFRILLTFGVVLDHVWLRKNPGSLVGVERALWHWRTLAVPVIKKEYLKPEMEVVKIQQQSQILAGSVDAYGMNTDLQDDEVEEGFAPFFNGLEL